MCLDCVFRLFLVSGPRGALIFFRRGQRRVGKDGKPVMFDLEARINSAVFPSFQGGMEEPCESYQLVEDGCLVGVSLVRH